MTDDAISRPDFPPSPHHFTLSLGLDSAFYTGHSFDLFSGNNALNSFNGSVGYTLYLAEPWSLVPELGVTVGSVDAGSSFGGALTNGSFKTVRPYAGVRVRYALLSWLEPQVRLGVGVDRMKATLEQSDGTSLEKSDVSWFGAVGAGVSVHTTPGALTSRTGGLSSFMLGATLEGGYSFGPAMDLDVTPVDESSRVRTTNASLGSLSRSAPYVRLTADLRF